MSSVLDWWRVRKIELDFEPMAFTCERGAESRAKTTSMAPKRSSNSNSIFREVDPYLPNLARRRLYDSERVEPLPCRIWREDHLYGSELVFEFELHLSRVGPVPGNASPNGT